ncbi:MAG: hypothetical protein WA961_14720 [Rhodanobacter sp.]
MTTEYRDETGKLLRVDKGTQPAKAAPKKPAPAAAPRAPAAAPAPAKKEK